MTATAPRLVVRAAVASMHAEPRISSPQISQRLAGHHVELLAQDGEWRRVRGRDGYEGWMHQGFLEAPDEPIADAVGSADPWAWAGGRLVSLGCVVHDGITESRRALPLGAVLRESETVVSGEAIDRGELSRRFPRDGAAIAHSAVELFAGTPYQWGGVTPWGADCSGLVQTIFGLHGVGTPRDAWQQAETGADIGSNVRDVRRADLLFFSDRADGRITHVGIGLGDRRMVHLALGRGGYAIERLDAAGDEYVRALLGRSVCARRVV